MTPMANLSSRGGWVEDEDDAYSLHSCSLECLDLTLKLANSTLSELS